MTSLKRKSMQLYAQQCVQIVKRNRSSRAGRRLGLARMHRSGKALKWIVVSLGGLVVVALIANAIVIWLTSVELERKLQELRAAGDPVKLTDLAQVPIAPEKNAAITLDRVRTDVQAMEKELKDLQESPLELDEEKLVRIRRTFDAYPQVLASLEQGAKLEGFDLQLDLSRSAQQIMDLELDEIREHRAAARLLRLRARQQVEDGEYDNAMQTCLTLLRWSRHFEKLPFTTSNLVAVACRRMAIDATNRVLRSGEISPSARKELETELALHDTMASAVFAFKSERVFGLAMFEQSLPWGQRWLTRGYQNLNLVSYLDAVEQMVGNASAVPPTFKRPTPSGYPVVDLVIPSFEAVYYAHMETMSQVRALRVFNALQSTGKARDAQIDLAAVDLQEETKTDPYSGKPLLVKQTPEGVVIYSIGKNLKDDGGRLEKMEDAGVGPIAAVKGETTQDESRPAVEAEGK